MGIINKNIEEALTQIDASEEDKDILRKILYQEHVNKEKNWDSEAPGAIKAILRKNTNQEQ